MAFFFNSILGIENVFLPKKTNVFYTFTNHLKFEIV